MNSIELRNKFLKFFESKQHKIFPSDTIYPSNDPTLLFTSAGMVQFKDYFLNKKTPLNKKITTCQKCFRTSDIDKIGYTPRHLSFFEMLGNFSFGDYFKKEAIQWAWEFLTEQISLDKEKLYITIYKDDTEAFEIWKKIVNENRIYKLDKETNFWTIGETGPCGPCSEIIFDLGENLGCNKKECNPGCNCNRWLEIWNLVFTQFNREKTGYLTELPTKNIDTGMGLERLLCVENNFNSVFQTDLFIPILQAINNITPEKLNYNDEKQNIACKIISDHLRGIVFLINDGIIPSNEAKGYVLRRIIRRAIRYAKNLKIEKPFLYKLAHNVIEIMKQPYPELISRRENIVSVIKIEEEKFFDTLNVGLNILDKLISDSLEKNKKIISGKEIFKLYDTYGFPPELSKEILQEQNLIYDENEFEQQKKQFVFISKKSWKTEIKHKMDNSELMDFIKKIDTETEFVGYEKFEIKTKIIDIFNEYILLKQTPFYPELGGQVADTGIIKDVNSNSTAEVIDVKKIENVIVHKIKIISGEFKPGQEIDAIIDIERRKSIARNHTATHLLHKTLIQTLGSHAIQSGSFVSYDRLRFDFSHFSSLTQQDIKIIENKLLEKILCCLPVNVLETDIQQARKWGAMALFGEKYGEKVRCVIIGESPQTAYSLELCGGTHVKNTGEIGGFKIINETSIGSGLRRIEAITGNAIIELLRKQYQIIQEISDKLKTSPQQINSKIEMLLQKQKKIEKEITDLKSSLLTGSVFKKEKIKFKDTNIIVIKLENTENIQEMRKISDKIKSQESVNSIILLLDITDKKLSFILTLTEDIKNKYSAVVLGEKFSQIIGGSCGGRNDFVQGGTKKINFEIDSAIKKFLAIL